MAGGRSTRTSAPAGLAYTDGTCAGVIVATAPPLPASRRMTVTRRRLVPTAGDLAGAAWRLPAAGMSDLFDAIA